MNSSQQLKEQIKDLMKRFKTKIYEEQITDKQQIIKLYEEMYNEVKYKKSPA